MNATFEEEIITMLTPKIKSLLLQTSAQNREDLEQELKLLALLKIRKGFNEIPPFFDLMASESKKGSVA